MRGYLINTPILHCSITPVPLRHALPLRQKHRQAFTGAARFQEFRHRQFVTAITAVLQHGDELRRALRQNNLALKHHGITGKMRCFFF